MMSSSGDGKPPRDERASSLSSKGACSTTKRATTKEISTTADRFPFFVDQDQQLVRSSATHNPRFNRNPRTREFHVPSSEQVRAPPGYPYTHAPYTRPGDDFQYSAMEANSDNRDYRLGREFGTARSIASTSPTNAGKHWDSSLQPEHRGHHDSLPIARHDLSGRSSNTNATNVSQYPYCEPYNEFDDCRHSHGMLNPRLVASMQPHSSRREHNQRRGNTTAHPYSSSSLNLKAPPVASLKEPANLSPSLDESFKLERLHNHDRRMHTSIAQASNADAAFIASDDDVDSIGTYTQFELAEYESSWSSCFDGDATYFTEDHRSIATEPNVIAIGVPKPAQNDPPARLRTQEDTDREKASELIATDIARKEHASKVRRNSNNDELLVERKPSAIRLSSHRRSSLASEEGLGSSIPWLSASINAAATKLSPDVPRAVGIDHFVALEQDTVSQEGRCPIVRGPRKTHSMASCSPPLIPVRRSSTEHSSQNHEAQNESSSSLDTNDVFSGEGHSEMIPSSDQSVVTNGSGIELDEKTRTNIVKHSTSMLISRRKRNSIQDAIQDAESGSHAYSQNPDAAIPCRTKSMPSIPSLEATRRLAIDPVLESFASLGTTRRGSDFPPPQPSRWKEDHPPIWCDEKQKYKTSTMSDPTNNQAEMRQPRRRPCDDKSRTKYEEGILESRGTMDSTISSHSDARIQEDLNTKARAENINLLRHLGETSHVLESTSGSGNTDQEPPTATPAIEAQAGVPVVLPGAFAVRPRPLAGEPVGQPSSGYDSGFEDGASDTEGPPDDLENPSGETGQVGSSELHPTASSSPVEAELYEVNYAAARVITDEDASRSTENGKHKKRIFRTQITVALLCTLLALGAVLATTYGNKNPKDSSVICSQDSSECQDLTIKGWTSFGVISGPVDRDRIEFGNRVALSDDGSRLIVGLPGLDGSDANGISTQTGGVHVLDFNGTDWSLNAEIRGSKQNGRAGTSVAISNDGSRIAFGAPDSAEGGYVLVYEDNGEGWDLLFETSGSEDTPGSSHVSFGSSVAFSANGDHLAVGDKSASRDNLAEVGQLMVFLESNNTWSQVGSTLFGTGLNDLFSWSVDISSEGTRLAASALGANNLTGQVRFFELVDDDWVPFGEILEGQSEREFFGASLAFTPDGNRVAIGATGFSKEGTALSGIGRVSVFDYLGQEMGWNVVGQPIEGISQFDSFGSSVSLSSDGNSVAIGSPDSDIFGENAGTVQVFEYVQEGWEPTGTALGRPESDGGLYGFSVSISGDGQIVASGAPQLTYDGKLSKVGQVWIFERTA